MKYDYLIVGAGLYGAAFAQQMTAAGKMCIRDSYYAMSSRDDFQVEVPEEVGTANMEDGVNSHVYYYLVDETAGTFTLVDSFDVPYSSLVSNAKWMGDTYVVNNGVHQCYEEYDQQGNLIRQYKYTCTANGYRVMKDSFEGFWFLPQ